MVELSSSYDCALVALSIVVATVSSYMALSIIPRVYDRRGSQKRTSAWAIIFGVSIGSGIWGVHFIAMLAFHMPVAIQYNLSPALFSLGAAIVFATLSVLPLRRGGKLAGLTLPVAGILMGLGISATHYVGMAAISMPVNVHFDISTATLSVLTAVLASTAALWIVNHLRTTRVSGNLPLKTLAALVMGLAISGTHYTGMGSARFLALDRTGTLEHGLDSPLLVGILAAVTILIQGIILVIAVLDELQITSRRELLMATRLSSLLKAIPSAVFSVSQEGLIMQANPAASRMFGYEPEGWSNMSICQLIPDDITPNRPQRVMDVIRSEQGDSSGCMRKMYGRRRDGSVFPCELSVNPYYEEKASYFSIILHDISMRERAESEAERLKIAVDQTPEGIFITDREGRIVFANPAAAAMYGTSVKYLLGRLAAEARGGKKGDAIYNDILSCMERGRPWKGDITIDLPGGEKRIVERHIAPVLEGETISYHVCVDTDVTKTRLMQTRWEHMQRLESLGVLAGGIAHDFNNILTAIMGNASLIKTKLEAPASVSQYLTRIEEAGQHAADLCKQMLAYSGRGEFEVRPVNLSQMVHDITKLLKISIAKNVVLKFRLDRELPTIKADISQLQQVIMNLVINASDAIGKSNGTISLSTGVTQVDSTYLESSCSAEDIQPGYFVFLEVTDTGCGMDKETQKRLFDPFFTTKFTGRGLGLSAVHGIVRGHHGAIRVNSEKGHGTCFKVLFPASTEKPREAEKKDEWGEWCGVGTVLVVDDEATIRETAAMMLNDMGFSTLSAEDGQQAVEIYRQQQNEITAVLLDMTMPKLDGAGCFHELRHINKKVPVVLSSGYNEQDTARLLTGESHTGFIQKPYTLEMLRRKMKEVLE